MTTAMQQIRFGWFIPTYGDFDRFGPDADWDPPGMELFERVALTAEAAGFEYALVPVATACWEAWIACAMISAKTTRLKMLVAARPGYTVPTQMAKMIATFDQLSGGRLCVNLIAGGDPAQLAMDGLLIPHDDRYSVMAESVEIMKAVWTATEPIRLGRTALPAARRSRAARSRCSSRGRASTSAESLTRRAMSARRMLIATSSGATRPSAPRSRSPMCAAARRRWDATT